MCQQFSGHSFSHLPVVFSFRKQPHSFFPIWLIRSLQRTGVGKNQKIAAAYQKYREMIVPIKRK